MIYSQVCVESILQHVYELENKHKLCSFHTWPQGSEEGMASVQQLPNPAEDPEIQQLTDGLLDLSVATDGLDRVTEHQPMEFDGDSSQETENAREPPMESGQGTIDREESEQHNTIPCATAFKIVGDNIDKKVQQYGGTGTVTNEEYEVQVHFLSLHISCAK